MLKMLDSYMLLVFLFFAALCAFAISNIIMIPGYFGLFEITMKRFLRIYGIVLLVFFIYFVIDHKMEPEVVKAEPSTESTTNYSSISDAPSGYHKGSSCSSCSGTGRYTRDVFGHPGSKGGICAGCNGKGYHWVKD